MEDLTTNNSHLVSVSSLFFSCETMPLLARPRLSANPVLENLMAPRAKTRIAEHYSMDVEGCARVSAAGNS